MDYQHFLTMVESQLNAIPVNGQAMETMAEEMQSTIASERKSLQASIARAWESHKIRLGTGGVHQPITVVPKSEVSSTFRMK